MLKPIRSSSSRSVAVLFVLLSLVACSARQPGDPVRPGFNVYSPEQDVQLGQEAAAQIRRQVDVVDNQALQNYVQQIGQRLAQQSEAGPYPYSFTVINDPAINAFALPGGPIFIHSGLIKAADNEAQLAGVLAHEIGHVALRHATNQASKANLVQIPAVLAGAALGQESILSQLGQLGLGLGVNSLLLKYSRDAEKQSDAIGAQLMANAGYNPIEMANFFEKLEAEGGSRGPQFLSSHPDPGNRRELVTREVQALPQREYAGRSGQFDQMQAAVTRLPEPRRPQQTQNAMAPNAPSSGQFQTLNANSFAIEYPQGWEAFGDRNSAVVTIAPPQGLVQTNTGVGLGYGAVVSYYQPRQRTNLQGATQELIQELASVNDIRSAGGQRTVNIGGSRGLVTTLTGSSPYGGAETNVLLTVARPEGLFYMVFVGPQQQFSQLEPVFTHMFNSIRFRG